MNSPFFSILVPVYNVEKYLAICLDSVLKQAFSDYEIILVDDGAKDNSGKICDDYQAKYPDKIVVHHKPNQGLISARRAGLKLAKGKYICFLDSDDCWMDNTLSRLYETITVTNADVVFYKWSRFDENGNSVNESVPSAFPQSGPVEKDAVFRKMLSTALINPLWSKCCRYELFDVDADYSRYYTMQNGEDLIQSLPVLSKAESFYYLNEELYRYRVNTMSITHVYQKKQYRTLNVLRPMLYEYIERLGLDTKENVDLFFKKYIDILWDNLEQLYRGIDSEEGRNEALAEIRTYPFVQRAEQYLSVSGLNRIKQMGVNTFYRNDNKKLHAFMRLYLPLIDILRKIRRN